MARRVVAKAMAGMAQLAARRILVRSVLPWGMLILILGARLPLVQIIAQTPEKALWPDSAGYLEVAHNWEIGRGISGDPSSSADLYRPPAYPALLAAMFRLAGENYAAVALVQLAMGIGVSLMLYWLGRAFWSARVGYLAALLYALTPNAILWALSILSDTFFVLLVTGAAASLGMFLLKRQVRWAVLSGLLVGVGTLTRPIGLVLVPLWIVLLALLTARPFRRGRAVAWACLGFGGVALFFIAGWAFRNQQVHGQFTVSPIDTWNMGYYSAPYTLARAEGISLEQARQEVPTSAIPQPGDRARYLSVILQHPLDYAVVYARGTWLVLSEASQPNQAQLVGERYQTPGVLTALRQGDFGRAWSNLLAALRDPRLRWFVLITWPALAFQAAVYVLSLRGLMVVVRQGGAARWVGLLVLATMAVFILVPGAVGTGRLRLPAEPFLCLLAAIGFWPAGKARGLEGTT